MSALQENRSYGLSSGKLSRGYNVSVLHVKLTDSAARAISSFQNSKGWSSHPAICFNGNQGRITVPCSDNGDELRTFTFSVTNVPHDNPRGSFNCFQQNVLSAAEELSCLGVIQKKMTVNATDDSYDKARQSMAQAEEETRSRGAIVIKHGGRYQGKKVTVRAPAHALASLPNPRKSLLSNIKKGVGMAKLRKGTCAANRKSLDDVQKLPLRERVTHLLALRPYKKPELILRLRKDGLSAGDKEMLDSVLVEVCQHSRDSSLILKDTLYKELQKDWSGYTSGDKQLLKRILVRRLFKPQQKLLTVPEAKVSPLRDTPNSSPAHRPKHSLPEEYTDPLLSKKPRISHLASKTASEKLGVRPSTQGNHQEATEARGNEGQRNSVDRESLCESLSAACQQEAETVKRLEPSPCTPEESKTTADSPQTNHEGPPSPLIATDKSKHTMEKKRCKHKRKDQEKNRRRDKKERRKDHSSEDANKVSLNSTERSKILIETTMFEGESGVADYLMAYTRIHSQDQRQRYKQDFNREYSEYRDLHARIDSMMRQFIELDSQLKQLHHDSHKYKTVHKKILQKYCKIKKSNPNYNEEKSRCEYLHNKLAHIKKLISEYDQRQLDGSQSPPN